MPLIPARFRRPDPEVVKRDAVRKDVEAVVKVIQGMSGGRTGVPAGMGSPSMPGSQFQGGWNNLGNASMAMLQRVTANMARQHNVPVAEIEQQLIEQGLTWGPPFPPGRPLDPFFGFRRQPRTWDYTVGENVQLTPRWQRVSFETLKAIYEAYDVAQICVRMKINDLRSLDYDWVPLQGERDDVSGDIDVAREFFAFPDKAQPFRNWLAEWMQDVLRYDAGALYVHRTNAGAPYSLEVVSGPTLIPLIDFYGRVAADRDDSLIPEDGVWAGGDTPGFLQIIEGMPWDWLTVDDIIYQPWNPLPESQYGLAPLEAILMSANTDLRFQQHFLEYFTAGSLPAGLMEAPVDLSDPALVAELQETWDALMVGDQEMLRRIRFVPNGSKFTPVKNADFDSEFPLYLMRRTAAAYGVTPANLGYTETVNRASSDTQVDIQWRVGTLPLVRHVEDVINLFVAQHLGLRCRLQFDKGQEVEDRLMTMQAHQGYVDMGAISVDEVRAELGKPIDRARPIPRFISNPRLGPIPLITIESMSGKIDEETYAPDASQELIPNPYIGSPGVVPPMGSPEAKAAAASAAQMQRELLQATTGQGPTPSMQAAIAAANPPPVAPGGPSKGPEGTTAQPAEVPPGQGSGSRPEPSQAAQTAAKGATAQAALDAIFAQADGGYGDMWVNDAAKKVCISFGDWEGELADAADKVAREEFPGYSIDSDTEQGDPSNRRVYSEKQKDIVSVHVPGWRQVYAKGERVADLQIASKEGLGGGGNISGIYSSSSGIQGDPLASGSGDPDGDDDGDETSELYGYNEEWKAAKSLDALIDLRRWRTHARHDFEKGRPLRSFQTTAIPDDVRAYVASRLEKAESRREVNAIFADVVAGRPFGDGRATGLARGSGRLAKYSDDEARDDKGEWTAGGGDDAGSSAESGVRNGELSPDGKKALGSYTSGGYMKMNAGLRAGRAPTQGDKALDEAIKGSTTTRPVTVYRGMNSQRIRSGQVIGDRGFVSTTTDKSVAQSFSSGMVVKINVPAGAHLLDVSAAGKSVGDEHEAILGTNSVFRVDHVSSGPPKSAEMTYLGHAANPEAIPVVKKAAAVADDGRFTWDDGDVFELPDDAKVEKAAGEKADEDDFDGVMAGGLIVQAQDTGRVLMIQRLPDKHDDDAAYARWEWPGGCLDVDDDGVWQGALREWEEETGSALDEDAQHVGSFLSQQGNYQAYVIQVPFEDDLEFDPQPEEVADIGWWDPADLTDGRVRDKVSENLEPLQRFLLPSVAKASDGGPHVGSGMVSLDLPDGFFEVPGGGVADQHITIVFFGKGVDDATFDAVCRRAEWTAASMPSPSGTISGLGSFPPSESSDWLIPVFAIPDVPALADLRLVFEDLNASEHKDFKPHVTLAYLADGEPLPDPIKPTAVSFPCLSVHRGDDVRRFPFGGEDGAAKAASTGPPPNLAAASPEGLAMVPPHHCANCCLANNPNCVKYGDWSVRPNQVCDGWEYSARVAKATAADAHRYTDKIVAHYQPLIAQAFEDLFPQNALREAIEQARAAAVSKYSDDQPRDDHGRWVGNGGNAPAGQRATQETTYAAAGEHQEKFNSIMADAASRSDGARVEYADMKRPENAQSKVEGKYGGDWSKIHDIVRGTIAVKSEGQLAPALAAVQASAAKAGWKVESVENRYTGEPLPTGYRDVSMHLVSPSGFRSEVQLNTEPMIDAKMGGGGHALYEQSRSITRQAAAEGRSLTGDEVSRVNSFDQQQRALYGAAYQQGRS